MSNILHVQQSLFATPERVFQALTDPRELEVWFAERAEVSLDEAQFDFWGRYTPETPSREEGQHRVLAVEPGRLLRFEWRLGGEATAVTIRFFPRPDGAAVGVWHRGLPSLPYGFEDVWFLALENLSRHLEGRDVVRCDFTTVTGNTIRHTVEIAAPPSAVWDGLVRPDQLERWIASRARVDLRAGGSWDLGWGAEGTLEVLSLEPERRLELAWDIGEGGRTVLTWALESSGGRTRLTLVHSGFAPGTPVEGLQIGWLHFMLWLKSIVEVGGAWLPAVKEIAEPAAMLYAASQWAQMAGLEGEEGVEAEVR